MKRSSLIQSTPKVGRCCICGEPYDRYGHNPYPVVKRANARCCTSCNDHRVIPARIEALRSKA